MLFILITLCFLLWIRDLRYIRRLWYLPGFLLFLGIVCAWGIPFWLSLGTKQISSLVSQEMSGRFVSGYAHPAPFTIIYRYLSSDSSPGRCLYLLLLYMPLSRGKHACNEKNRCIFLLMAYSNLVFFSMSHSKLMTYVLPFPLPLPC